MSVGSSGFDVSSSLTSITKMLLSSRYRVPDIEDERLMYARNGSRVTDYDIGK